MKSFVEKNKTLCIIIASLVIVAAIVLLILLIRKNLKTEPVEEPEISVSEETGIEVEELQPFEEKEYEPISEEGFKAIAKETVDGCVSFTIEDINGVWRAETSDGLGANVSTDSEGVVNVNFYAMDLSKEYAADAKENLGFREAKIVSDTLGKEYDLSLKFENDRLYFVDVKCISLDKEVFTGTGYEAITDRLHVPSGYVLLTADDMLFMEEGNISGMLIKSSEEEKIVYFSEGEIDPFTKTVRENLFPEQKFTNWDVMYKETPIVVKTFADNVDVLCIWTIRR